MSHISLLDAEEEVANNDYQTPHRSKKVKSYMFTKDSDSPPKATFTPWATPAVRKTNIQTDLVATIEEEENLEILKTIKGKVWKLFSVSPLFRYYQDKIQNDLELHLKEKFSDLQVDVETIKGLRGHRDDAECLRILVTPGEQSVNF